MFVTSDSKLRRALSWRARACRAWLFSRTCGRLIARSSAAARLVRSPVPGRPAWRRGAICVLPPGGGLGDTLLCTPALRAVKRLNPSCRVVLLTNYSALIIGLPFVDRTDAPPASAADLPPECIRLRYDDCVPTRRHLASVLGDHLGVRVPAEDCRPECAIDADIVGRFRAQWDRLKRPWVLINRKASGYTPNKDWPEPYWIELIGRLAGGATVIEIGAHRESPTVPGVSVDLRGRTSLPELVAAIAAADVHVGPISGPVHIAAAAGVRSVVIYGGYEEPSCSSYPGNVDLYTPLQCAPCWLESPCQYGTPCLSAIAPAHVEVEVTRMLRGRAPSGRSLRVLAPAA